MADGAPIWIGLFLVFAAMTARDMMSNYGADAQKDIPEPKFSKHLVGPSIKFLYCYS